MTNLFLVWEGTLITPDLSYCGICGIMRELILEAAACLTIPTRIQPVYLGDLYKAEEAFVCNSIIGIWPIRQIQGEPAHLLRQTRLTFRLVESVVPSLLH
jgi:4-amino-4-deoxychorismate lyase